MRQDDRFGRRLEDGMSFARVAVSDGRPRQRAFVLEAVALTAFLALSMAVIVGVFGSALQRGQEAEELTVAITLAGGAAENGAEAFAANPAAAQDGSTYYVCDEGSVTQVDSSSADAYEVRRTVESRPQETGVLYTATIQVLRDDAQIYEVQTSGYVSERGR